MSLFLRTIDAEKTIFDLPEVARVQPAVAQHLGVAAGVPIDLQTCGPRVSSHFASSAMRNSTPGMTGADAQPMCVGRSTVVNHGEVSGQHARLEQQQQARPGEELAHAIGEAPRPPNNKPGCSAEQDDKRAVVGPGHGLASAGDLFE